MRRDFLLIFKCFHAVLPLCDENIRAVFRIHTLPRVLELMSLFWWPKALFFFLFVCFCFLLKTPVSEQSSTEAAGSAVHIPHITVNQGRRFSVEFETRSGEDFVMPAVLTSFGSSASEYFCLLLFTKKMSTTLTLNLDPSCKWFYCNPSIYFIVITKLCNHIFHFYGLMASWDAFQESCTSPMIKKKKKKNSWGKM